MNSYNIYSEMEYGRACRSKTIAEGELNGIKYYVVSKGTHPCAYVVVTKEEAESGELAELIECHGGITYQGTLNVVSDIDDDQIYVLGWDYAHWGDYVWSGFEDDGYNNPIDSKYTVQDIIYNCIRVASQVSARRAAQKAYDDTYQRVLTSAGVQSIQDYCDRLAAVWSKVPQWRLGQLMSNMERAYTSKVKRDIFFPDDEDFMSFIENYIKEITNEET